MTIDAMGCQKKIALKVMQKGSDHLLVVKENQLALADAFEAAFPMVKMVNLDGGSYVTDEKNRGLQETRHLVLSEMTE